MTSLHWIIISTCTIISCIISHWLLRSTNKFPIIRDVIRDVAWIAWAIFLFSLLAHIGA